METLWWQAVGEEVLAQRLTKPRRAAEPDAGGLPFRNDGTDALAIQSSILAIDQQVQTHACSFGICRETVDGGLIELGSRMKEINRLCVRGGGALLEAGDKRRDADARTHPNLMWLRILEVETAVRAFHRNRHADLQSFPQAAGVVAQRLGDEDEPTVSGVLGGGDGVRMRAFVFVRSDEGELPGGMAAPAVL